MPVYNIAINTSGKSYADLIADANSNFFENTEGEITGYNANAMFSNLVYSLPLGGSRNVSISNLQNNDVLLYDTNIGKWKNSKVSFSSALENPITVNIGAGNSVGGVNNGDILPSGTTFEEIFKKVFLKSIAPTYTTPSVSISSSESTSNIELGTNISMTLSYSFNTGDSGGENYHTFYRNSVALANNTDSIQVTESANSYTVKVYYNTGAIKNDNLGNAYPTGRIMSGVATSNTITYIGYRKGFYGFNVAPTTSSMIRSLTGSFFNPQNGSTFSISIPVGTTKVIFAYPSSLRTVSSVKYVEGLNAEIKEVFVQSTVSVEANNGYSPINYYVYTFTPLSPYGQVSTYNITI